MKKHQLLLIAALGASVIAGSAQAQLYPRSRDTTGIPSESGKDATFKIKRKTISGTVKSVDVPKKRLVMENGKGSKAAEIPVEVGPSIIKAGKGGATVADIRAGDKITVFGELTVQGGIRAMEITLPKERMSIAPPEKPKKTSKKDAPKEPAGDGAVKVDEPKTETKGK
jgi:hypothetical protein